MAKVGGSNGEGTDGLVQRLHNSYPELTLFPHLMSFSQLV